VHHHYALIIIQSLDYFRTTALANASEVDNADFTITTIMTATGKTKAEQHQTTSRMENFTPSYAK
jgi:hypothetical protein